MRAVTIKTAKAHLNQLVEEARRGVQVVLVRGSEHVAALVPISADDLELNLPLTDAQASRLWKELAEERVRGETRVFGSADEAVAGLRRRGGSRAVRARSRRPDTRTRSR